MVLNQPVALFSLQGQSFPGIRGVVLIKTNKIMGGYPCSLSLEKWMMECQESQSAFGLKTGCFHMGRFRSYQSTQIHCCFPTMVITWSGCFGWGSMPSNQKNAPANIRIDSVQFLYGGLRARSCCKMWTFDPCFFFFLWVAA